MRPAPRGRVILVGAGPGDPDLLTLRGAAALREADAVVYDALAPPELLELAPTDAERIDVGRRGHDEPTRPQEEINALLVGLARQGKTVVRLKGGDPFVFGRGGEEASACARAGIPFEVVPGVSSAIGALAYAGIPVTDRRHSASFAVVTGHKDPTRVREAIRWRELARGADTLVVLMAMRNLEEIVARLREAGLGPETPAAAVMLGSLPSQRVVEAPLASLAQEVRRAGLTAPAAVVVGDVVRLRRELGWYESLPLFGLRVLVTRAAEQAEALRARLRAAGAEPVSVPLLRFEPVEDPRALDAALDGLGDYDAILLTSGNAARFLGARAEARGKSLAGYAGQVLCVGPATAREAERVGLRVQAVAERRDAEGLLAEVKQRLEPSGRRFLLPRAERARDTLPDGLRQRGATVDAVTVYRSVAPDEQQARGLRELLASEAVDALPFTSPSAVRHFLEAAGEPAGPRALARCAVVAIGPATTEALECAGRTPDAVAPNAGAAELVEALATCLVARRQGGSG